MRGVAGLTLAAVLLAAPAGARPIVGADVSSLPRVEAGGGVFRAADTTADALALLRAAGVDAVRLRVWHSPADGACGVAEAVALARRAHARGMRVLLDPHFSDTWADPGHQSPPAAWRGLPLPVLADSVRAWTRDLVADCVAAGATPEWIQLGNEVDGGLLWDTGRLGRGDDGWEAFATLLRAAADGAREGAPRVRRVLHVSAGGDADRCAWFYAQAIRHRVPFEVIGVSYYPWWHGSVADLAKNIAALATRFGRDVMVVETAYPWTLRAMDDTHNPVGEPAQLRGWPATPQGQAAFARAVRRAVARVPGGRGAGTWWWEPAWIAAPRNGSPWENCALFDSTGRALPALRAFGR